MTDLVCPLSLKPHSNDPLSWRADRTTLTYANHLCYHVRARELLPLPPPVVVVVSARVSCPAPPAFPCPVAAPPFSKKGSSTPRAGSFHSIRDDPRSPLVFASRTDISTNRITPSTLEQDKGRGHDQLHNSADNFNPSKVLAGNGIRHYIPLLVGPIHSPRGVKTLAAASWRWLAARLRTKKKDAGGDIASSSRGRPRTHSWE